jgi:MFS family permease
MLGLSGMSALLTTIAANSLIQHNTPYEIRGKVMGVYTIIFSGSMAFGGPVIGLLADLVDPQNTLIIGGLAIALVSTTVLFKKNHQ